MYSLQSKTICNCHIILQKSSAHMSSVHLNIMLYWKATLPEMGGLSKKLFNGQLEIPLILKEIASTEISAKLLNNRPKTTSYRYYLCLYFNWIDKLLFQGWLPGHGIVMAIVTFLQQFIQSQIHLLKEFYMNEPLEHDVYKPVNISNPSYLVSSAS